MKRQSHHHQPLFHNFIKASYIIIIFTRCSCIAGSDREAVHRSSSEGSTKSQAGARGGLGVLEAGGGIQRRGGNSSRRQRICKEIEQWASLEEVPHSSATTLEDGSSFLWWSLRLRKTSSRSRSRQLDSHCKQKHSHQTIKLMEINYWASAFQRFLFLKCYCWVESQTGKSIIQLSPDSQTNGGLNWEEHFTQLLSSENQTISIYLL